LLPPHPAAQGIQNSRVASRGPKDGSNPRLLAAGFRLLLFGCRHEKANDQHPTGGISINELRVNGAIRAKEVRVVAPDGEQIGVKKLNEALWLAEQLDLDLVEVAPNAKPPVCRLMDYGRYKYEQSVKEREARKKQTRTNVKELRMRVRIGEHDFDITRRKTQEFLLDNDKVKITIRFRGRERERPEFGRDLMNRLAEEVADYATVEQAPKIEGGSMTMVLAPTKQARSSSGGPRQQKDEEE
jgi:translation initiation factor IF-3